MQTPVSSGRHRIETPRVERVQDETPQIPPLRELRRGLERNQMERERRQIQEFSLKQLEKKREQLRGELYHNDNLQIAFLRDLERLKEEREQIERTFEYVETRLEQEINLPEEGYDQIDRQVRRHREQSQRSREQSQRPREQSQRAREQSQRTQEQSQRPWEQSQRARERARIERQQLMQIYTHLDRAADRDI